MFALANVCITRLATFAKNLGRIGVAWTGHRILVSNLSHESSLTRRRALRSQVSFVLAVLANRRR
jgi:selenocysteine lyase/cysteine desulfurase